VLPPSVFCDVWTRFYPKVIDPCLRFFAAILATEDDPSFSFIFSPLQRGRLFYSLLETSLYQDSLWPSHRTRDLPRSTLPLDGDLSKSCQAS